MLLMEKVCVEVKYVKVYAELTYFLLQRTKPKEKQTKTGDETEQDKS